MFTGLIKDLITVSANEKVEGGYKLNINRPADWNQIELGESISIDGVCLTVTSFDDSKISFFIGPESLAVTNLQTLKSSSLANAERSLTMGDRLGGHLVSGHVDGTALVSGLDPRGECLWIQFSLSPALLKWVMPKGSICINGVSLTVNEVNRTEHTFEVLLIPETLTRTNLKNLELGQLVNIECDQVVKIITEQLKIIGDSREQHL